MKSILMVETKENCYECELCFNHACAAKTDDSGCCCGGKIMREVPDAGKPDWCPLAKLPNKDRCLWLFNEELNAQAEGWNDCIDKIVKKCTERKENG